MNNYIAELAEKIKEKNLIFFFGAGASKSANLPLGFEIIDWFLRNIVTDPRLYFKIKNSNYKLRFEKTISLTSEILGEKALKLLDVFNLSRPTIAHNFVARCAKEGLIHSHLTTNFDNLIEQAFEKKRLKQNCLYSIEHFKKVNSNGFNNYLLHGTTPKNGINQDEIISTMDSVLLPLNYYKEKTLIETINNKTVVFVGYSAWDHDIFPILKKQIKNSEYWFVSPDKFDKNKRIVELLDGDQSRYLTTTSDELFTKLFKSVFPKERLETQEIPSSDYIEKEFNKQLSFIDSEDRAKIVVKLLTFMSLTNDALEFNSKIIKNIDKKYWLYQEADILYQSGKWEKLKPLIEDSIDELVKEQSFKNTDYSALARILLNSNFYEEAEYYAQLGYNKSIDDDNKLDIATSGLALGNVLLFRGRHKDAFHPFNKALESCVDYPGRAAYVKMPLGVLNYRVGNIDESEKQYLEALKIFEESTDKFSIAKCQLNLAELYRHDKTKLSSAFQYIDRAKELAYENNYHSVLYNLAPIEMLALKLDGSPDKAIDIGLQAIEKMKSNSQQGETYANTVSDTGLMYYALGEFEKALSLFQEALDIFISIEQFYRIPLLYSNIAEVLIKMGDYPNAEEQIEIAKTYFDKFGSEESGLEVTLWVLSAECKLLLIKKEYELCKPKIDKGLNSSKKINDSELILEFEELKKELKSAANNV